MQRNYIIITSGRLCQEEGGRAYFLEKLFQVQKWGSKTEIRILYCQCIRNI